MKKVTRKGGKYTIWYRRMLDIDSTQGLIEQECVIAKSTTMVGAYNEARDLVKRLTFKGHYMLAVGLYDAKGKLLGPVEKDP